ncbi:unnamed protein product [Calypogeia fissa]
MTQNFCCRTPILLLKTIKLSSPSPPAHDWKKALRIETPSPICYFSSFSALRQPATADFLRRVTIATPESTEGLRAKFGRLLSLTSSATSTAASGKGPDSTTAKEQELEGETRPMSDSAAETSEKMQTLYLSHGSPLLPIQYDFPARNFMIRLGKELPKPKAILMISAHWDTTEPTVTCVKMNETIYDFYGFPRELYQLKYEAPGSPELAHKVVDLLKQGGFPKAKINERRGLDHGAWVPLLMMYPERDVPVVQLSVQYPKDGAHHYKAGQALTSLKNEGVLVIGSGSATHNLGAIDFNDGPIEPWALAFGSWLNEALCKNRYEEVINYREKAPYARKAHPTPDHFLPAIVALGAAGQDAVGEQIHTSWALGTLSMDSYALKAPASAAASA